MEAKYNPQDIEKRWYQYWQDHHFFHSEPDTREAYTIVIPPPNVTGVLHMGHVLNETIQDVLVRRARLEGKNACWVPGTDHASIATEAKVIKRLKEQGIQTLIHYPVPPHKQECYREWNDRSYPITERIHDEELSLPLNPVMTLEEAMKVVQAVQSFR